jgi:molybdenum cofactor biosynthesis enzyme MoaA
MNDAAFWSGNFDLPASEAKASTVPAKRYHGFLDDNDGSEAHGWVHDVEHPDGGPVEVECFLGDELVATVLANEPRPDLKAIGRTGHGFRFRFPRTAVGALSVRIKGSEFVLPGSPMARKPRRAALFSGCLDDNDGSEAHGWVHDVEHPDGGPIEVECFLGDELVATVIANESRPDLKAIGRTGHGFRFRFPRDAVGALSVRIKGSEFVLPGSPMSPKPRRATRFSGYLDGNDGFEVVGWAYGAEHPDGGPVEVECFLGDRLIGTVTADESRPDLEETGKQGHGFRFRFPAKAIGALRVRIKDTGFVLPAAPVERKSQREIAQIAGDIVNQCNLRCPFCCVDYSEVGSLQLMTADTFARAIPLMAMTERGAFWLSCLHEPTLHPRFVDFIEAVPEWLRDRISFTTNLAKRLPDEFFTRLANSGVDHIRVSFDSREPQVFAELRKKGRYEVFERNLLRLCAALKAAERPPRLHLITMAFTSNYREIPDIIRFGRDIGATSHEVRFVYYMPHIVEWGRQHLLSPDQWSELETSLLPLSSPTLSIAGPAEETRGQFEEGFGVNGYQPQEAPWGGAEAHPPAVEADHVGRQLPDAPLRLRLRWDGLMMSEWLSEEAFSVNVAALDDPAAYFEAVRAAALI